MEILDFDYNYTHENPFPVLRNGTSSEVDKCFEMIFQSASRFLF
jgi:hypothetical protein